MSALCQKNEARGEVDKGQTLRADSENKIPLFAMIPICMPYSLAKPVTRVVP
jgi:hypothetical protein